MINKYTIPSKFKVGALNWEVDKKGDDRIEQGYIGSVSYLEQVMFLAKNRNNIKVKKDQRLLTFNHELVHIILNAMGEDKLNNKEKFVEGFARLLTEFQLTRNDR